MITLDLEYEVLMLNKIRATMLGVLIMNYYIILDKWHLHIFGKWSSN